MSAGAVAGALADLVLASRCAGCGEAGSWFCVACRDLCDPITLPGPLRVRGAGSYGGALRDAIHRLKYGGERGLAAELGALVAAELARDLARGALCDALVPVVLHRSRAVSRGYDQARLLAAAVSVRTGLPVRVALHRTRHGRPQVELDRRARAANVRRAFLAEAGSLRGLRVALIDDVVTTGATLAASATALLEAGAVAVSAITVARER
jgi:ComF family protein